MLGAETCPARQTTPYRSIRYNLRTIILREKCAPLGKRVMYMLFGSNRRC